MEIGFDLISDLYLQPEESFNWENKATSLYCLLPGNVSSDLRTLHQTLAHLSNFYQGIFYVPGTLEYSDGTNPEKRTKEIHAVCKKLPKVAFLDHNVVILEGVAILGANGWAVENIENKHFQYKIKDIAYLSHSIQKLQKHLDVKHILLLTNAVPKLDLYYKENLPDEDDIWLEICLAHDTERKIKVWCYGTSHITTDTILGEHSINFVNNSFYQKIRPYWPKRININV